MDHNVPAQPSSENIIFLHLPKTAGSTINNLINQLYPEDVIFSIEGNPFAAVDAFASLSQGERAKFHVIKGHLAYGFHHWLVGKSHYFTFLREPIDRVLSDYYFILRTPSTPHHAYVTENNLSLKEVVESTKPLIMMHNTQTILLSGLWQPGIQECSEEVLERAMENLRRHFTVCITERFDESLLLLKNRFKWQKIDYQKANVTLNRPNKKDVPQNAVDAIVKTNQFDIRLYQFALSLFEQQVKASGRCFSTQVKLFQLFNRLNNYYLYQKRRLLNKHANLIVHRDL